MDTLRVTDGIVDFLRDYGVRYFFSVSGANIEPIHDAIHQRGHGKLRSILTKHESGASFMADAHARIHRTLGVCGSTSGGGMLNLMAGIAEANASSVPLLALIGQPPMESWGKGGFQDSSGYGRSPNAEKLFAEVAKYAKMVDQADDALAALENAVVASTQGRPGASVLLIPRNILLEPLSTTRYARQYQTQPPETISDETLASLAKDIVAAKAPLLVLGQGIQRSDAQRIALEFAEQLQIPAVVTLSGKGSFPNLHPLFRGVLSASGHPGAIRAAKSADLLIVVGASLNLMTRAPVAEALKSKRIIYLNVEAGYIDQIAGQTQKLLGDAKQCLSDLLRLSKGSAPCYDNPILADCALGQLASKPVPPGQTPQSTQSRTLRLMSMYKAVEAIRDFIPDDANLLIDAGNTGATASHLLPCPSRGAFATALGMGGMGWAVAGGIGAALGLDENETRLTVIVAGDGAMLMNGSELNTLASYQLPVIIVVLNNAAHGMCITRQQIYFDARIEAVSYPESDFTQYAKSLTMEEGIEAHKVESIDDLKSVFGTAIQKRQPCLIEVPVTQDEIPPFTPFLQFQSK